MEFESYMFIDVYLTIILFTLCVYEYIDRLCGLVVRVHGYRSGGPGLIPGSTRKKKE
jgi:hypothetical protein